MRVPTSRSSGGAREPAPATTPENSSSGMRGGTPSSAGSISIIHSIENCSATHETRTSTSAESGVAISVSHVVDNFSTVAADPRLD